MRDEKKDLKGFVKTFKKKVHDWRVRHPRATRILEYFGLLLLFSLAFYLNFTHFKLFHTDAESARYMLSALVQSQAAIVAIVISLTLIAVQLTASAYSPRVIDIFKKNLDMWILLGFYGFSIFYGLFLLKLVEGAEGELVSQSAIRALGRFSISFEFCVSLAYWLGAFTFVVLIAYMWNIMGLLKPESIINQLTIEITKDKIIDTEEDKLINPEKDPAQPLMDMIRGSIMKYDFLTARTGLRAFINRGIKIINSKNEKVISRWFCGHLEHVGKLAVSKFDEESTLEVSVGLFFWGKKSVEKGLEDATSEAAKSLEGIGRAGAEKDFKYAIISVTSHLIIVGIIALEKRQRNATKQAARSLAELTILSEGIVKITIRNRDLELEEQDRDSFQKFIKIYEQELEKLQAGK